jgi:deoxyribose-phosphate aldolase
VAELALAIDHSLLQPQLTDQEIAAGCQLAARRQVISVCVRPSDVSLAARELDGADVKVTTVAAFPHGASTTPAKVAEAVDAVARGAEEIDMVINIGKLLSGETGYVRDDIAAVAEAVHASGALLKAILENHYLDASRIALACHLAEEAGADFVKTSTGYAASGAKAADVALMRASVAPTVQVKAAGGIRTLMDALGLFTAGATRLGTRMTEAILDEAAAAADGRGSIRITAKGG